MGLEVERRFLVEGLAWRAFAGPPRLFRQGYLASSINGFTVRIRISSMEKAWLTIKAPADGIARYEFEYLIPLQDAEAIWHLTPYQIIKKRYNLSLSGGEWIVDCFEGNNKPLVLAEVELNSADDPIDIPKWCWQEITGESQWSNAFLAHTPIANWSREKRQMFKCD